MYILKYSPKNFGVIHDSQATTNMSVMENIENPTTNPNNLPGFGASKTQEAVPTTQDNAEKAAPATNNAEKVSDKAK